MSGLNFMAVLLLVIGVTLIVVGMRRRGPTFLAELKKK